MADSGFAVLLAKLLARLRRRGFGRFDRVVVVAVGDDEHRRVADDILAAAALPHLRRLETKTFESYG